MKYGSLYSELGMTKILHPLFSFKSFVSLLALPALLGRVQADDFQFNVTGPADWNDAANWLPVSVGAGANDRFVNSGIATITSNTILPARDTKVGVGGGSGRVDHSAGVHGPNGWTFIGTAGGTGVYNLADTSTTSGGVTGFGQGSGTLNYGGRMYLGDGGVGTLNVNTTGTVQGSGVGGDDGIYLGVGSGEGTLNLQNGQLNAHELYVGQNNKGTLRMSGGTLNVNHWSVIGTGAGANGLVEMTGGTMNQNHTDVLSIGQNGTGTFNMSGTANLNDQAVVDTSSRGTNKGNVIVGRWGGGNGTWNLSGNATARIRGLWVGQDANSTGRVNISENAALVSQDYDLFLGGNGTGRVDVNGGSMSFNGGWTFIGTGPTGNGTLNVNSGSFSSNRYYVGQASVATINVTGGLLIANDFMIFGEQATGNGSLNLTGGIVRPVYLTKGPGTANLNFNGGTLQARQTEADFIRGFSTANLEVMAGGLKLDSNSQTLGINTTLDGPGAVTKLGAGTLNVYVSQEHLGGTIADGGLLALHGANNGLSTAGPGALTVNSGAIAQTITHNALGQGTGTHLSPLIINGGRFEASEYVHVNTVTMKGGQLASRSGTTQVDGMDFKERNGVAPSITSNADATTAVITSKITAGLPLTVSVADGAAVSDLKLAADVVGSSNITKTGAGNLVLAAPSTSHTGSVVVSEGTVSIAHPNALGAGTLVASGGKISFDNQGLFEGKVSSTSAFDTAGSIPQGHIAEDTTRGNSTEAPAFGDNTTWGYKGYINVPGTSPINVTFAEQFDDSVYLSVNANAGVLNNSGWDQVSKATVTLQPGRNPVEVRFGNGGGGVGPNSGWNIGIGVDPLARDSTDPAHYTSLGTTTAFQLQHDVTLANNISLTAASTQLATPYVNGLNSITGVISGTGGLEKTGPGSLQLTGTNTYTGNTILSEGKLVLENSIGNNSTILGDGDTATANDIHINGGHMVIAGTQQIADTASILLSAGSLSFSGLGRVETIDKLTVTGGAFTTGRNSLVGLGATITWAGGTNTISSGGLVSDKHWVITGGTNLVEPDALLRVQTGTGTVGLNFGGTNSPTISIASDDEAAGEVILRQPLTVDSSLTSGTAIIQSTGTGTAKGLFNLDGTVKDFTVHDGSSATDLLISARIHSGGFDKKGAGTMEITSTENSFASAAVTAGTLLLGANNVIPDAADLTLSGGKLATNNGMDSLSTLSVTSGSVIDMGTSSGSVLTFADAGTWTGMLSIWNYNGAQWTLGTDKLIFTDTAAVNLANVTFYSDAGMTQIGSAVGGGFIGTELVPVPESSTLAALLGLVGAVVWRDRRRFLHYRS